MKPSVFHHRDGLQLSYEMSHPVHDAQVYPRQSSNGSTVIVYGTDQGLCVLWYGGRNFKPAVRPTAKLNGSAKNDSMVIDLDEDEDAHPSEEKAEFEAEEEEVNPATPYRNVLRQIEIPLGAGGLRLCVPNIPSNMFDLSLDNTPAFYKDHIVVAAACTDLSIRVVILPLQPPSPDVKDFSKLNINVVKLFGRGFHQDLISSIAITHTADSNEIIGEVEDLRSRSNSRNRSSQPASGKNWSFLVASASCTGSGLLLIHQLPLISRSQLSTEPTDLLPIRRLHLGCSLMSSKLSFNPSSYPSERHTNLLIALPDASCTKIYQVHPQVAFNRTRRGSAATQDSTSTTRSSSNPNLQSGRFLLTLLTEYSNSGISAHNPRRKSVLDAKWVLGGRAVIALLEDGGWGIWDLEATGPKSASTNPNLIKGQGHISGIQGGAWTKFALRGTISLPGDAAKSSKATQASAPGAFALATPHTRKTRAEGFFHGNNESSTNPGEQCFSGSVFVSPSTSTKHDESVVLSYGGQAIYISSIMTYWKSEATGKGSFDAKSGGRATTLPPVRSGGEAARKVMLLPPMSNQSFGGLFGAGRAVPNFLISTEARLILFLAPLVESVVDQNDVAPDSTIGHFSSNLNKDQSLLQQGELDVDGMERLLEEMNGSSKPTSVFGKSVGFRKEEEGMDLASPTPNKSKRLQLGRSQAPPRRLFS